MEPRNRRSTFATRLARHDIARYSRSPPRAAATALTGSNPQALAPVRRIPALPTRYDCAPLHPAKTPTPDPRAYPHHPPVRARPDTLWHVPSAWVDWGEIDC